MKGGFRQKGGRNQEEGGVCLFQLSPRMIRRVFSQTRFTFSLLFLPSSVSFALFFFLFQVQLGAGEVMLNQAAHAPVPMAVGDEHDVLGHFHGEHPVHHLGHGPEGLIIDEQGVQVGLARLDGLVDIALEDFRHQPHDGVLGVGHLGEGVVDGQGLGAVPFLLRDGAAQQGFKFLVPHVRDRAEAVARQGQALVGVGGVGALDFQNALQPDILAGRADLDLVFAALYLELVGLYVEIAEGVIVKGDFRPLGFPGLEGHPPEALELLGGAENLRAGQGHVQLGNFVARDLAGVGQVKHNALFADFQIVISESGIAQAKAEGEADGLLGGFKVPVAHEQALPVFAGVLFARVIMAHGHIGVGKGEGFR